MLLPAGESDWLAQSGDELCMRKCAYSTALEGQYPSENRSTINVPIPLANVFDVGAAQRWMTEAERRQLP